MLSDNPHESEESSLPDEYYEKVAPLLAQHHHTVLNLQQLLTEKDEAAGLLQAQLEDARRDLTQQTGQLSARLQAAEATIAALKSQSLSSHVGEQFSSSESANTAFLMLYSKNK